MAVRRIAVSAVATATALAFLVVGPMGATATPNEQLDEYTVVAGDGVSATAALAAITAAGGRVTQQNNAVGMYQVVAGTQFPARADASPLLAGAARQRPIGTLPKLAPVPQSVEREGAAATAGTTAAPARTNRDHPQVGMDPLDSLAWGLTMIHGDTARAVEPGERGVTVGILDSGIDASHPDLAGKVDLAKSRNFAPDLPDIDGPCEVPSCLDPIGTDDNGHGTHTAGTIGAAANGLGVSGVAPNVTLVELKGGQDSGFVFVAPVVNALTYAGDIGIDVVNMSFYADPWLYNCLNNPADTAAQQAEQRAIITVMSRALNYAHRHGVTLLNSMGNNHEDVGNPRTDMSSPDYPLGTAHPRVIDNATCLNLPMEGPNVLAVTALGPSGKKADYSSYGVEHVTVAAPGGWFRDGFGTPSFRTNANTILSTYPKSVLLANGQIDADGNVTPGNEATVLKDCTAAGVCGYYVYLQGTSMASPHAAGVAALIVSRFGERDRRNGGLTLDPSKVARQLTTTATEHACPDPPLQSYVQEGRSTEFDALCVGDAHFNGFYGYGIVNAYAAVTTRPAWEH